MPFPSLVKTSYEDKAMLAVKVEFKTPISKVSIHSNNGTDLIKSLNLGAEIAPLYSEGKATVKYTGKHFPYFRKEQFMVIGDFAEVSYGEFLQSFEIFKRQPIKNWVENDVPISETLERKLSEWELTLEFVDPKFQAETLLS